MILRNNGFKHFIKLYKVIFLFLWICLNASSFEARQFRYSSKFGMFQKSLCKGLGLLLGPWPPDPQDFFGECSRKVAHSRNTLRFAKSAIFFSNTCITVDISKTRHARALIFSGISHLNRKTKVAQRGCDQAMAKG